MCISLCALLVSLVVSAAAQNCAEIDGARQSPININTSTVVTSSTRPLKWTSGYAEPVQSASLVNDGYSLKLTVSSTAPALLSGGYLDVEYEFQQLHLHWGDSDGTGSEHKIDDYSYPLEMHAVHSQKASNSSDQYVVVTYFFRVSQKANSGLQKLVDATISAAENKHVPITVSPLALNELLSTTSFSYFTYKGSLTTPPYTESVTWIISSTALPISAGQLETLREAARIDTNLNNNYRCLQNLNNRIIGYVIP